MQLSKSSVIVALSAVAFSGCVPTPDQATATTQATSSITTALSGRTLTNENAQIALASDGRMSGTVRGEQLSGSWSERNGQYCRTITSPARLAGSECQDVVFNPDGTITIDGVNGPVTWTLS